MNEALHDQIRPYRESSLVLIHSPTFNFESFDPEVLRNRGYYAYPPRALQCLKTSVDDLIPCSILDLNYLILKNLHQNPTAELYSLLINILEDYLQAHPEVKLYGVSTGVIVPNFLEVSKHPFLEILSHLKKKDGLVLAGGAPATIEAQNLIEGGWADIVFKGEAEAKLRYLLNPEEEPTSGICYWNEGQYVESLGSEEMVDFQASLIPSYSEIPIETYHQVGCLSPFQRMAGQEKPFCTIQLIRGCRMKCTFCGLSQYRGSNKVCEYPDKTLFDEIQYLNKERGIKHFSWLDEDLLAGKEEVKEILRRIIEEKLDITWSAPTGLITAYIDEELLDLAVQSGCTGFRVGIESGNPEVLKRIKKPGTLDKFRRISRMLQRYPQLFVCGLYMIGFESETYGQMLDTYNFAVEMNLSWSHFSVYQDIEPTDMTKVSLQSYRDWLPSPHKVTGAYRSEMPSIMLKPEEIFALPRDQVHDPKLLQEIWFAFNLKANYLMNKKLDERWLSGLQATYPRHPVIKHFLNQKEEVASILEESPYWRQRFQDYGL